MGYTAEEIFVQKALPKLKQMRNIYVHGQKFNYLVLSMHSANDWIVLKVKETISGAEDIIQVHSNDQIVDQLKTQLDVSDPLS